MSLKIGSRVYCIYKKERGTIVKVSNQAPFSENYFVALDSGLGFWYTRNALTEAD